MTEATQIVASCVWRELVYGVDLTLGVCVKAPNDKGPSFYITVCLHQHNTITKPDMKGHITLMKAYILSWGWDDE